MGSEMCIRDSLCSLPRRAQSSRAHAKQWGERKLMRRARRTRRRARRRTRRRIARLPNSPGRTLRASRHSSPRERNASGQRACARSARDARTSTRAPHQGSGAGASHPALASSAVRLGFALAGLVQPAHLSCCLRAVYSPILALRAAPALHAAYTCMRPCRALPSGLFSCSLTRMPSPRGSQTPVASQLSLPPCRRRACARAQDARAWRHARRACRRARAARGHARAQGRALGRVRDTRIALHRARGALRPARACALAGARGRGPAL